VVATSPLLVWYSQEARSYALYALLSGVSFLFFGRALRERSRRSLAWWALASSAALAVHYFAAFIVAPEAVWLLVALRSRRLEAALAAGQVTVVALMAVTLAEIERARGIGAWIARWSPLRSRVSTMLSQLPLGISAPHAPVIAPIALLAGLGAALVLLLGNGRERRGAIVAATVGLLGVGTPMVVALAGLDVFQTRNVIGASLPLSVLLGIAWGTRRACWVGGTAALAICAIFTGIVLAVDTTPQLQRNDLRALLRHVPPPTVERAIILSPHWNAAVVELYLSTTQPTPTNEGSRTASVRDLAVILPNAALRHVPRYRRIGAFLPRQANCRDTARYRGARETLLDWRCALPVPVSWSRLGRLRVKDFSMLLQHPFHHAPPGTLRAPPAAWKTVPPIVDDGN
jgi:hypothetical protein